MPSSLAASYDEVPFPSQAVPQSHPDRLAVVASLFGRSPRPIDRARVLELGCANGANLIPMADRHRESRFVGIDFSAVQIAAGRKAVEALGLRNIELQCRDFGEIDESFGTFDYVIAHGIFSWVAPAMQERLLAICRANLAPEGVAYVSYNIYPGWHLRGVSRTMMCGATPAGAPARQRIAEGRKLMEFFSRTLAEGGTPYNRVLKADVDKMLAQSDDYLLHDLLEEENNPLYFHEFIERAAGHGLQYLGDAVPSMMFAANHDPGVEQNLKQIVTDFVSMEQHLDLLRNRAFRQTLLCHAKNPVVHRFDPAALTKLYLAANVRPKSASPEVASEAVEAFETFGGVTISTPSPAFKAALLALGRAWPCSVAFDELAQAARGNRQALLDNLVQCAVMGVLDVYSRPDDFVAGVSDRPQASAVARWQAGSLSEVTNRRHESVALDDLSQNLLRHLDGQNDRVSLVRLLVEAVDRGELSILVNAIPASRGEPVAGLLEKTLDEVLKRFAASALLVA